MDRRTSMGAASVKAVSPAHVEPVRTTEWVDHARRRRIPVLIRTPQDGGPAPLVLVSHGLGGSREGLAYLGRALAGAGYAVIHLQHAGSDAAIWQGAADPRAAMMKAAFNPAAALARLRDIEFALDRVISGREPGLAADTSRIAIAGHSYGAWTATHMLGERLPVPRIGMRLPDSRLRAGIALSPVPPLGVSPDSAYRRVSAPMLYVTGTRDEGLGVPHWRARTLGFQNAAGPACLAVLEGAQHASFAGEEEVGGRWNDPAYHARTAQLGVTFLDTVLRDDQAARAALLAGAGLPPGDKMESKGLAYPSPPPAAGEGDRRSGYFTVTKRSGKVSSASCTRSMFDLRRPDERLLVQRDGRHVLLRDLRRLVDHLLPLLRVGLDRDLVEQLVEILVRPAAIVEHARACRCGCRAG